jgi:hypothetical protein
MAIAKVGKYLPSTMELSALPFPDDPTEPKPTLHWESRVNLDKKWRFHSVANRYH